MDIYASWLPDRFYYLTHLLLWLLPVVCLQWLGFWRILWPNRGPILLASFIVGFYLCLTDMVAVRFGVWDFDPALILGISPGGVPIEEWGFFFLTSLLVAQSFVLFLPQSLRRPNLTKAKAA